MVTENVALCCCGLRTTDTGISVGRDNGEVVIIIIMAVIDGSFPPVDDDGVGVGVAGTKSAELRLPPPLDESES